MPAVPPEALPWAAASAALLVAVELVRRAWARQRRVRRALAAGAAERRAESLLRRRGYRVVGRQVRRRWPVVVGGRRDHVDLRVDLVVTRGGRRFVAEVKHGDLVASAAHGPTRRQLLEYLLAYGTDGVLLVDAGAGTIDEIRFPRLAPPPLRSRGAVVAIAATVALVAGWAAATRAPELEPPGRLIWRRATGGCAAASAPRRR